MKSILIIGLCVFTGFHGYCQSANKKVLKADTTGVSGLTMKIPGRSCCKKLKKKTS